MTETQPTNVSKPTNHTTLWIVLGAIVIIIAGLLLGVLAGINARKQAELNQIKQSLGEQFNLGVQELDAGQYDRARQRFEYVLKYDPAYPGAQDKLTEAMVKLSATATPSASPTPEISPTPDLRGAEELFNDAQQKINASDWDGAQLVIDTLRKNNPDYKAALVDGMYYILLRNRGVDKILNKHNLEGGIYDLTLAERFGPLDNNAAGLRNFSRLYLTGSSLWGVDWAQVVNNFQQLAASVPNLTDSSGYTAGRRYFIALVEYGKVFMSKDKPCDAQIQFDLAASMSSTDELNKLRREATDQCLASLPPTPDLSTPTPSLTPEGGGATEPPPTELPTETPTEIPTEIPTP
jgi:tetratricopeptide (TPR) repeat protein